MPAEVPVAKLFPTELPELQWQEFHAAGFESPVAGTIFHPSKAPCCGVPLGGISTGCMDLDVKGVYGFSSVFNRWSPWPHGVAAEGSRMARKAPHASAALGPGRGRRDLGADDPGDARGRRDQPIAATLTFKIVATIATVVKTPQLQGVQARPGNPLLGALSRRRPGV